MWGSRRTPRPQTCFHPSGVGHREPPWPRSLSPGHSRGPMKLGGAGRALHCRDETKGTSSGRLSCFLSSQSRPQSRRGSVRGEGAGSGLCGRRTPPVSPPGLRWDPRSGGRGPGEAAGVPGMLGFLGTGAPRRTRSLASLLAPCDTCGAPHCPPPPRRCIPAAAPRWAVRTYGRGPSGKAALGA